LSLVIDGDLSVLSAPCCCCLLGRWADGASSDAEAATYSSVSTTLSALESESVSLSLEASSTVMCREMRDRATLCLAVHLSLQILQNYWYYTYTGRTVVREEFHEEFLFVQKLT
jgi:hypothetical protein